MDSQTINQNFDLLALVETKTTLRKAGANYIGPCPMCGGRDRFTLKATPRGWRWHCRHCGDGRWHNSVDFVMQLEGLDFRQALERVGGGEKVGAGFRRENAPKTTRPEPVTLPSEDWQRSALNLVTAWSDLLGQNAEAQAYLISRGFHSGTWNAWLLGFVVNNKRPAIVVPWLDSNGEAESLSAAKFRYFDKLTEQQKGQRFAMHKGSKPFLFGLQHVLDSDDILLLVEGEFNAMSVWQCLPSRVAAVSIGSEANRRPDLLKALARRFRRVVVWMDDPTKAIETKRVIEHGNAVALRSPEIDGIKWDANQMLQAGILPDFITNKIGVPCLGYAYGVINSVQTLPTKQEKSL